MNNTGLSLYPTILAGAYQNGLAVYSGTCTFLTDKSTDQAKPKEGYTGIQITHKATFNLICVVDESISRSIPSPDATPADAGNRQLPKY